MAGLDESLRDVLGGKAAKKLDEAFGLHTTGDLLRHYPRRYASAVSSPTWPRCTTGST